MGMYENQSNFKFEIGLSGWIGAAYIYYVLLEKDLHLIGSGASNTDQWTVPAIGVGIFFGSVLIHELGHAFAFLLAKVRVTKIALEIWGGYTAFEDSSNRMRRSAKTQFWTSAAGPLANALVVLIVSELMLSGSTIGEMWDTFSSPTELQQLWWTLIVMVNAFMVVVNVMPVFPLDGGGLVRGILMGVTGSWTTATILVATISVGAAAYVGNLVVREAEEVGWAELGDWWILGIYSVVVIWATIVELSSVVTSGNRQS